MSDWEILQPLPDQLRPARRFPAAQLRLVNRPTEDQLLDARTVNLCRAIASRPQPETPRERWVFVHREPGLDGDIYLYACKSRGQWEPDWMAVPVASVGRPA